MKVREKILKVGVRVSKVGEHRLKGIGMTEGRLGIFWKVLNGGCI